MSRALSREAARAYAGRRGAQRNTPAGQTATAAPQRRFETPESLPQATIASSKLNRAVGTAARMTDSNYHQYARRVLSRAFGYDDLTSEYSSIIREHERAGHLTQPLSERVDNADNEMFRRIRMQYGNDILRRVYRGL